MELITFKLEENFLTEIDTALKKANYQSRTEFIRSALRDKLYEIRLKSLIGSARKLSAVERKERIRELEGKDASYILRKYGLD